METMSTQKQKSLPKSGRGIEKKKKTASAMASMEALMTEKMVSGFTCSQKKTAERRWVWRTCTTRSLAAVLDSTQQYKATFSTMKNSASKLQNSSDLACDEISHLVKCLQDLKEDTIPSKEEYEAAESALNAANSKLRELKKTNVEDYNIVFNLRPEMSVLGLLADGRPMEDIHALISMQSRFAIFIGQMQKDGFLGKRV